MSEEHEVYQYRSPNGHLIVGTAETVLCTALITGISEDGEPMFAGESEVHWDSQRVLEREGKALFACENGDEWTFDQLVKVEDEAAS